MRVFQSIRWRIQLWHSLLLAVIVSVLGTLFYFHEKQTYLRSIDGTLLSVMPRLIPRFSIPKEADRGGGRPRQIQSRRSGAGNRRRLHFDPNNPHDRELIQVFARKGLYFAIWDEHGHPLISSQQAPTNIQMVKGIRPPAPALLQTRHGDREVVDATPDLACVIVGMKLHALRAKLAPLARQIAFACLGILISGIAVGWWLTGRATRPFSTMKTVAERVAGGELQARVPVRAGNRDETSELAHALNETFARLEQSFEELRRFTADASHELRTPISAALLQVQVALRKDRDAAQYRESLATSQKNLSQLRRLAESLLDLSRLDSGELKLEPAECDLSDLVKQTVEEMAPVIAASEAKVSFDATPAPLKGDPEHIRQVVSNLVGNAIQHSPKGVAIRIATRSLEDKAQLEVADDGPGISAEDLPLIFQRFFRSADARKDSRSGAGLGLSITRSIVLLHHGNIEVNSESGQGTRFVVELPVSGSSPLVEP